MDVPDAKRLKALEDENAKLKELLAEPIGSLGTLRAAVKKMVGHAARVGTDDYDVVGVGPWSSSQSSSILRTTGAIPRPTTRVFSASR
jgi:hypothetical protein